MECLPSDNLLVHMSKKIVYIGSGGWTGGEIEVPTRGPGGPKDI